MVEIKNLSKKLSSRLVLDDINYSFEYGKVYGLCGPNGSGKTMLLRAIAGLIVPTSGKVVIDGKVLHKDLSFPPNAGIVIENMTLLPQFNAFDNLKLLGDLKKKATDEDIKEALKRVGLSSELKVRKYSLGMKQRLNIAQAIFEKQNIILLDEPTNALDEDGVQLIYNLIREERDRGALVIVATHHEEDLQEMCDTILSVSEGRIREKQNVF
jgi:ABC-2 type transport system ATP-binding protein